MTRVAHPAALGLGVEQQPHAPEVDLQLVPGLAVCHSDRRPLAPSGPAQLGAEALQSPDRHRDPLAGEQGVDLHHGQVLVVEPRPDLLGVGLEAPPGRPVAIGAMGPHLLHHQAHEDVVELVLSAVALQAGVHRRLDVAPDGLAVDPRQPLDRPQSLAPQPEPEHLSHLEHPHLPEGHRRSLVR